MLSPCSRPCVPAFGPSAFSRLSLPSPESGRRGTRTPDLSPSPRARRPCLRLSLASLSQGGRVCRLPLSYLGPRPCGIRERGGGNRYTQPARGTERLTAPPSQAASHRGRRRAGRGERAEPASQSEDPPGISTRPRNEPAVPVGQMTRPPTGRRWGDRRPRAATGAPKGRPAEVASNSVGVRRCAAPGDRAR